MLARYRLCLPSSSRLFCHTMSSSRSFITSTSQPSDKEPEKGARNSDQHAAIHRLSEYHDSDFGRSLFTSSLFFTSRPEVHMPHFKVASLCRYDTFVNEEFIQYEINHDDPLFGQTLTAPRLCRSWRFKPFEAGESAVRKETASQVGDPAVCALAGEQFSHLSPTPHCNA